MIFNGENKGGNAQEAIKGFINSPLLKYSNLPDNKFVAVVVNGYFYFSNESSEKNFLKNFSYLPLSKMPGLFKAYNEKSKIGVCLKN